MRNDYSMHVYNYLKESLIANILHNGHKYTHLIDTDILFTLVIVFTFLTSNVKYMAYAKKKTKKEPINH